MVNSISSITSDRHLSVCDLLGALADGWQAYLPAVAELSATDMRRYLAAQRYEQQRDLLAHATAQIEETLGTVPVLLRGIESQESQRYHDQLFTAQVVARFSLFSDAEIERRFTQAHRALAQMLAFLPAAALERPAVYASLYTTIVEDFNTHRPPNLPAVPLINEQ